MYDYAECDNGDEVETLELYTLTLYKSPLVIVRRWTMNEGRGTKDDGRGSGTKDVGRGKCTITRVETLDLYTSTLHFRVCVMNCDIF